MDPDRQRQPKKTLKKNLKKKARQKKIPKKITYELYLQGKSIKEIAKKRGFVTITIEGKIIGVRVTLNAQL